MCEDGYAMVIPEDVNYSFAGSEMVLQDEAGRQ
jgi:hypothetical protein